MLKVRDLSINKNYRDFTKKWGEPEFPRKRVIIAPPMSKAETKDVDILPMKDSPSDETEQCHFAEDVERLFKLLNLNGEFPIQQ